MKNKLFDPLGLLSPIMIQLKLLFQLICFDKLPWNQEMPDSISDKCLKLVCQLRTLNRLVIPRQNIKVIKDEILSIELHGFCDSSLRAYVSFLSGKTKVAPMKGFSIPRLELLGCGLLTKLMNSVKAAIKPVWGVQNVYYWTDSEISLYRKKVVDKEWKPWVESRVNFVRDGSVVNDWNFVPSGLNPAHIVTREFDFIKTGNNDFYFNDFYFVVYRQNRLASSEKFC